MGTVDTVAGPRFCEGPAIPDASSARVGAVAVDDASAGALWYESGDSSQAVLTKVVSTASVLVVPTGVGTVAARPSETSKVGTAGIAADSGGGVLIARATAVLRFAEADGLATVAGTIHPLRAGTDRGGTVGDGAPLASARFTRIAAIASDATGNVFVADELDAESGSIAIRFLNRSPGPVTFYAGTRHEFTVGPGTIGTVAGASPRNVPATAGDGKLTAAAPTLAVEGHRLYLGSSPGRGRRAEVRVLNLSGAELLAHGKTVAPAAIATIATVVGDGDLSTSPVAVLGGIDADGDGNLFLAESGNHRVRKVDGTGAVTTYAGTGSAGFNGNDLVATTARLDQPHDVAVGAGGRVYISDAGNAQVRFVDQAGVIHAALGNGAATTWRCALGPQRESTAADVGQAGNPSSVAADEHGNVYVASVGLARVHRLSPSGALNPIAGRPASECANPRVCAVVEGAPATTAGLLRPASLAERPGGGLYLLDGAQVRFVNLTRRSLRVHGVLVAPGTMRTVADVSLGGDAASAAAGPRSGLATSSGALAADRKGNLLVAEAVSGAVRQVDSKRATTTLVARSTPRKPTGDPDRCCTRPGALAFDGAGNLYIAEVRELGRVWFLNRGSTPVVAHGVTVPAGGLAAVAGSGSVGVRDDGGRAVETHIGIPSGLTLDGYGNLYIVDHLESTVRRVDTGGIITTSVGTGGPGFNGDGLKGPLTALRRPTDLAVDACGNLLVADSGNDRVRRLNLSRSCPTDGSKVEPADATGARARWATVVLGLAATALAAGVFIWRARRSGRGSPFRRIPCQRR